MASQNSVNIGPGDGLLPDDKTAITWTNVDLSLAGSLSLKAIALEMQCIRKVSLQDTDTENIT